MYFRITEREPKLFIAIIIEIITIPRQINRRGSMKLTIILLKRTGLVLVSLELKIYRIR